MRLYKREHWKSLQMCALMFTGHSSRNKHCKDVLKKTRSSSLYQKIYDTWIINNSSLISASYSFNGAKEISITEAIVGWIFLCWFDTIPAELWVVNALQIGLFWVLTLRHWALQIEENSDMQISEQNETCAAELNTELSNKYPKLINIQFLVQSVFVNDPSYVVAASYILVHSGILA